VRAFAHIHETYGFLPHSPPLAFKGVHPCSLNTPSRGYLWGYSDRTFKKLQPGRYLQLGRGYAVALTDVQIRKAKPDATPHKLANSGGLHFAVTRAGGKLRRLKYRVASKEKLQSLGAYPTITLAAAREAAAAARRAIVEGGIPRTRSGARRSRPARRG